MSNTIRENQSASVYTVAVTLLVVGALWSARPVAAEPGTWGLPKCAPGYIYQGGHPLSRMGLPPVWIGGRCTKINNSAGFTPVGPAQIYPAYYLLTILYAVPGEASEAKYGIGSSIGSKSENTKSFKAGVQAEVETNVSDTTFGYAATSKDGKSFEVKRETTTELTVSGTSNDISHDKDLFYLWTNPEVDLTQVGPTQVLEHLQTKDNQPMVIVSVTAAELKDPTLMPDWKKTALSMLKDSDRTNLLSLDPLLTSPEALSTSRYVKIDTLQLDGPDHPGDPVTGQGLELDSEQTSSTISGTEQSIQLTLLFGGAVSFGFVSKVMVGADFEWTWETTDENSNGTLQKFEVTLKTAAVGHHAVIDVYEDVLFNSLVFKQRGGALQAKQAILSGIVRDGDAKPLANELVAVQMPDGSVRRVFSNAQGVYRVFGVSNGTLVKVGLRGREQAITLKNTPSTLHVQLPKPTAPHPTKSH